MNKLLTRPARMSGEGQTAAAVAEEKSHMEKAEKKHVRGAAVFAVAVIIAAAAAVLTAVLFAGGRPPAEGTGEAETAGGTGRPAASETEATGVSDRVTETDAGSPGDTSAGTVDGPGSASVSSGTVPHDSGTSGSSGGGAGESGTSPEGSASVPDVSTALPEPESSKTPEASSVTAGVSGPLTSSPATQPPATAVTDPVTSSPGTSSSPVTTQAPVTTSRPVSEPVPGTTGPASPPQDPADARFPVYGYASAAGPSHVHSYSPSGTVEPSCRFGGYTLYVCDCGACEIGDTSAARGHSLLYAAYDLTDDAPAGPESPVALVSFCTVCLEFSVKTDILENLRSFGITADSLAEGPGGIVFEYGGKSYRYSPEEPDLSTHTVPDMPDSPRPVEPAAFGDLLRVDPPALTGPSGTQYPSTMIMRDGSAVNFCWYKRGGTVEARVLTEYLDAGVGECCWGWSFDSARRVWTFGVWYHPQLNSWYFRTLDFDPAFS